MSQSGSQAAAFFQEVAEHRTVFFVVDGEGDVPTFPASGGPWAMPYFSSLSRAQRAAGIWGAGLRPVSATLEVFRRVHLPGLEEDGCVVGVNWTGPRLTGWDFTVPEVQNRLDHVLGEGAYAES